MLEQEFPGLHAGYKISSPKSFNNNCLAWALGDKQRWWEKGRGCYWPDNELDDDTVAGWIRIFELSGYETSEGFDLEDGFERVAIFADRNGPTHVARQMDNGEWTSKLRKGNDTEHRTAHALEGDIYGTIIQVIRRRIK